MDNFQVKANFIWQVAEKENIRGKFENIFDKLLLDFVNSKFELYKKLSDPQINSLFKRKLFDRLIEQHGL